ncbi:GNAT family N-acetyltransferase [Vibrio sp. SCSIO 43132]|uniref:GNAT family N-acetyltransferase n=1 Tax=Vibrio sp. SCSIO 43132 TaxID=2779363 RepID=UPI001CA9096B|nr:GNAT family N-acetyltransferase [Vibrio sp. SCSIO 43132]UAB71492.1 GNAT family N-acetyltransferase [Vibrio sp. SCSIO 43132]
MLSLQPMEPKHLEQVSDLRVEESQLKFVGTMEEILVNVDDKVHPNVMLSGDRIVGFFLIDTSYPASYEFAQSGSLGLRAFFIDSRYQGNGYGKQAVASLKPFLNDQYPSHHSIYLTVNCKNPGAYRCYDLAGFQDTQELYHGGAAGPQHIMVMPL